MRTEIWLLIGAGYALVFLIGILAGMLLMLRALRKGIARDPQKFSDQVARWAAWKVGKA